VDEKRYKKLQERQLIEYEARCTRCGACCGAFDGDPCEHLAKLKSGYYKCRVYKNRFGDHKTIKGDLMECVPIREILHINWPGGHLCAYKKDISNKRSR